MNFRLKTIDRFMLKAYIGPMFATFFIVLFILIMNGLWLFVDELIGKGLPASAVAELMFFYSSTMIPMGLPLSTLLAAIMTMGNMGENYELTALKAAGISLVRIIRSVLILAVGVSILSFFMINNYVPYSFQRMGAVLMDIRNLKQEIEFTDGVFFNGIPDISIRVNKQDKSTRKLNEVLIYDNRDRNLVKTIIADSGYINISPDKKFLNIKLFHGENIEDNRNFSWYDKAILKTNSFKYQEMTLALTGFGFENNGTDGYSGDSRTQNITELQTDIDSLRIVSKESVKIFQDRFLRGYLYQNDTTIIQSLTNDSVAKVLRDRQKASFSTDAIDTLSIKDMVRVYDQAMSKAETLMSYANGGHAKVTSSTIDLYKSEADWHRKLSLPVSVFIFFLIGAPLGAIIRKGGLGLPVVISVLFFVIYYVLTMMGEKMVKEGTMIPFIGMWLSSIVLGPIAIFLTVKSKRDSQLFNIEAYINNYKEFKKYLKELKKRKINKNK